MINIFEVKETNNMIDAGESGCANDHTRASACLDCVDRMIWIKLNENIYRKITTAAKNLVSTGEEIEQ